MKQSSESKNGINTTAIYCRVATMDEMAIEWQQQILYQFAAQKGYIEPVCFADNGASGLTFDRPAFAEMETAIAKGEIKTILVKDLSRIGRNTIAVMEWLDNCEKAGITVISMLESKNLPLFQNHLLMAVAAFTKGGSRK